MKKFSEYPVSDRLKKNRHFGREIEGLHLDEKIGPLLLALWEKGYSTRWSCQGGEVESPHFEQIDAVGYLVFNDDDDRTIFECVCECLKSHGTHLTSGDGMPDVSKGVWASRGVQLGTTQNIALFYWPGAMLDEVIAALAEIAPAPVIVQAQPIVKA